LDAGYVSVGPAGRGNLIMHDDARSLQRHGASDDGRCSLCAGRTDIRAHPARFHVHRSADWRMTAGRAAAAAR